MKQTQGKKLLKVDCTECPNCGSVLVKTHSHRNLQNLDGRYYVDTEIARCINELCESKGIRIYPAAYRSLIYPKSDYGLQIYAEVGYQRLNELKSVPQIRSCLNERYPHLKLKDRTVENIFKRVQVCLRERQEDKDYLREQLEKSGVNQLCFTMDGIAPEQGKFDTLCSSGSPKWSYLIWPLPRA